METERATGNRLKEWVRRYLPCEIAGTTCEFGGAAIAYLATGSFAAAAIVATIGASSGTTRRPMGPRCAPRTASTTTCRGPAGR